MTEQRAPSLPVARVVVDMALPHLDRPFDYAVPAELDDAAQPGVRVRVRFAGRLCDGYVLERLADSDAPGALAPLAKVVSPEAVLTAEVARVVRRVADHYGGTFADVVRLAIPPRHATTEQADRPTRPAPRQTEGSGPLDLYPGGAELVASLAAGESRRAGWALTPTAGPDGDWVAGFVQAADACLRSGRGVLLLVPDHRDLALLQAACADAFGKAAVATLTAEQGPSARYRAFLAALRGDVRLVLGTRAAVFAPVHDLGLVAVWDAGDDLYAEPRAPYPHLRDVAAMRATEADAALLYAGYHRSAEVQAWAERGWLASLQQPLAERRRAAPAVRAALDSDAALERDPVGQVARLPGQVFETIRAGLAQGPVLVQVPRAGYLLTMVCQQCREPARCASCHGQLRRTRQDAPLACATCGALATTWACPTCGGTRLRAPRVGATRTAEELGRAFPLARVIASTGDRVVAQVDAEPALVIATPGGEPRAVGGYAAAVLLDGDQLLQRGDLRAGEEAFRRWLNATALIRPGGEGGSVLVVAEPAARAVQALVRLDAVGFAQREVTDRLAAHFPPSAKLVSIEGRASALADLRDLLMLPEGTEVLGPVEVGPSRDGVMVHRLTLRAPLDRGPALVGAVKAAAGVRSARKDEGALRIRVDPAVLA